MKPYFNPVKVIKTNEWVNEIKFILQNKKSIKPLIITSKGQIERINIKGFFNKLPIISDVPPNPTIEYCNEKLTHLQNIKIDSIIAIGGGSVMDAAKVFIASQNTKILSTLKLIKSKNKMTNNITTIFVPTTHGTGSEVTMWGTIWDMKNKIKYSISNPNLYPNYAILDYNLTKSLPEDLSIITSMDALSHSFESIWNINKNNTSTKYAIQAITLIINNASVMLNHSLTNINRKNLLYASTLAGLAFSNTKTAAAHSISYPLTMYYNMPHGIASSITLIPLLILSENKIKNELKRIYNSLEIDSLDELIKNIESIYNNRLNYRLRDWGIKEKELPMLIKKCFTKERMKNFVINMNEDDIMKILRTIF